MRADQTFFLLEFVLTLMLRTLGTISKIITYLDASSIVVYIYRLPR